MDLASYLARIGHAGPVRPDLATLRALHLAHGTAIPFENLSIQLGQPVRLDVASLEEKMVRGRRGGYCFEQNTLFLAALREVGFSAVACEARVRPPGGPLLPRTHMVVVVTLDGQDLLCDVGFGGEGPLQPVPLDGTPTPPLCGVHRVAREGPLHVLQLEDGGSFRDLYAFVAEERYPVDFEVASWYASTHPESRFVKTLTAQLSRPERRVTLRHRTLTEALPDGTRTTREVGEAEVVPLLRGVFGLDVPEGAAFRAFREEPERLSAEARYRLLLDLSRKVRGTLDLGETLDRLLGSVRSIVEYDAAGIFVLNEDVFSGQRRRQLIAGVARRGFEERPPDTDPMLSRGMGIVGHVIRTGESVVAPDVRLDPRYVVGRASTLSEVAVPITVGERTIGALNLESDRCGAYGDGHLEALRFFAEAVAVAVDKAMLHRSLLEKQQLEAQLRVAHQVQTRLLPQGPPAVPGYDIAAVYIPSWELAGDYYDFFPLPGGRLGMVIADVAGKGVPAALIMATFRALLRAHVAQGATLPRVAADLDRLLRDECRPHGFVTCFLAVLEPATGRLTYTSCGHVPPLLVSSSGGAGELAPGGPVLGVFEKAAFEAREVTLGVGDTLVLHTDGVVEARRPDGEELGSDRLRALVTAGRSRGAAALADEIVRATREFTGSPGFDDDFTLVLVERCAGR